MPLDPLTAIFGIGKSLIEKIWPNKIERAREVFKLEELKQEGNLAKLTAHVQGIQGQLKVNAIEAAHKSIFVAGWRPFIGWACGFGLVYACLLEPFIRMIALFCDYKGEFPKIDTTITMQVLFGMLGLGVMRTREKEKGVHSDTIRGGKNKSLNS